MEITVKMTPEEYDLFRVYQNEKEFFERRLREETKKFQKEHERTGLRTVDVISGGFPCQPFSTAGKRKGKNDDRFLWPEMLRVISEIRPSWVVGENVVGIVSMELDQVLSDLEAQNYTVQAFIIPACAVDAPHRRDRCVIVGHSNRQHETKDEKVPSGQGSKPSRGGFLAHANGEGSQGGEQPPTPHEAGAQEKPHGPACKRRPPLPNPDDRGGAVRRIRNRKSPRRLTRASGAQPPEGRLLYLIYNITYWAKMQGPRPKKKGGFCHETSKKANILRGGM